MAEAKPCKTPFSKTFRNQEDLRKNCLVLLFLLGKAAGFWWNRPETEADKRLKCLSIARSSICICICLPKALCARRVSGYRGDRLLYQRGLRKCDESQSIARGRVKRLFAQLMWLDPVSSLSDSRTWLRHAKFWFDLDFLCMVNSRRSSMPLAFHIFHSPKRATWFCAHARHTDTNAWFDESSKCEWTSQVE